jgi:thioredoxin-related protein
MIDRLCSRLFWVAAILACVAAPAAARAQHEALRHAGDLAAAAREARARQVPVLLAFMQKTCPYCAIARKDYLEPMQADPAWRGRVIMLEIDVDEERALRDFAGAQTTHRAFARRLGVRRVPTLIVFDSDGEPAARPIVGLAGSSDFYRLYITQAIETGLQRQRRAGAAR